jgi:hypothetical protein
MFMIPERLLNDFPTKFTQTSAAEFMYVEMFGKVPIYKA